MDKQLFMDLLHVAQDDYQAQDSRIEGIVIVTVRHGGAIQMGMTISPERFAAVLDRLADSIEAGNLVQIPQKNMIRKVV